MPIVEIEGIGEVEIEGEITPERIAAVAADIRGTSIEPQQSYLESRARMGPTMTPVLAATAAEALTSPVHEQESIADRIKQDPLTAAATLPFSLIGDVGEPFARHTQTAADIVGADLTTRPEGIDEQMLGGTVEAVTDPMSYMSMPLKAGSAALRALGVGAGGAGAEVGGEIGAMTEKEFTGEDTGIGRLIGGSAAGTTAGMSATTTASGFDTVVKTGKAALSRNKLNLPKAQRQMLAKIADEQGHANIDAIIDEFNHLGHSIDNRKIPLLVAMSDNPVVAKQVMHLAQTDPLFRQKVTKELASLSDAVETHTVRTFGERYPDIGKPSDFVADMNKKLEPIRNQIEDTTIQIEKLSDKLTPTMSKGERGMKIRSLVDQRRKAVQAEMSPQYKALMDNAAEAGAVMPPNAVRDIYQFVKQNNLRDLFGKGTPLDNQVLRLLAPKGADTGTRTVIDPVYGASKEVAVRVSQQYNPLTFEQVDSLKRAVNELKRKPLNANERRLIGQFDDVVKNARESIPGDFNQRLMELDSSYYQKIGVPFSNQGIVDIDAKKYYEQVAPVLLKNKSALDDFLNVSGDDGVEIARNAVMADVYDKAVKDGVLNQRAFSHYIGRNSEVIDAIPGMRQQLDVIGNDHTQLLLKKDALDRQYKESQARIGQHFLSKASDAAGVDYTKMIQGLFTDKKRLDDLFSDFQMIDKGTVKAVKQALRAELIEHANRQPQGAFNFLTDVKNRNVVARIMGTGYQQSALDTAKLFDAIRRSDITKIGITAEKEAVTSVAGVKLHEITGIVRRPIVGPAQKGFLFGSKAWDATRAGRFDESMKELFLDPESLAKLKKVSDHYVKHPVDIKTAKKNFTDAWVNALGDTMPVYMYTGTKPAAEEERR